MIERPCVVTPLTLILLIVVIFSAHTLSQKMTHSRFTKDPTPSSPSTIWNPTPTTYCVLRPSATVVPKSSSAASAPRQPSPPAARKLPQSPWWPPHKLSPTMTEGPPTTNRLPPCSSCSSKRSLFSLPCFSDMSWSSHEKEFDHSWDFALVFFFDAADGRSVFLLVNVFSGVFFFKFFGCFRFVSFYFLGTLFENLCGTHAFSCKILYI